LLSLTPEQQVCLLATHPDFSTAVCERLESISAAGLDWKLLAELCREHRISALVARRLEGVESIPQRAVDPLVAAGRVSLASNLRYLKELRKISDAFNQAGIPFVALKGILCAETVYGDLSLRSFSDLDLLIGASLVEEARACMTKLGYKPILGSPRKTERNLRGSAETSFIRDESAWKAIVELKTDIFKFWRELCRDHVRAMERVFAECHTLSWEGSTLLRLPPELMILHMSFEQARTDATPFRRVVDLAWLTEKYGSSADPVYLLEWAHAYGLEGVLGYSLRMVLGLYGELEGAGVLFEKLTALDRSVGRGAEACGLPSRARALEAGRGRLALGFLFRGNILMFRLARRPLLLKARILLGRFWHHLFWGRRFAGMARQVGHGV